MRYIEINIVSFINIPMFNFAYCAMHNVLMHVGAIIKLLHGFASVRSIIYSLKLVDYLLV